MPVTTRRAAAARGKSTEGISPQALPNTKASRSKAHAKDKVKKAKRSTKSSYLQPKLPSSTRLHAMEFSLSSDESDAPALPQNPVYRPQSSAFQPRSPEYQPGSPSQFNPQPQPQASVSAYRTNEPTDPMGSQSTHTSLGQAPRMIPTKTAVRFSRPSSSSGKSFERRLSQAAFGRAAFSTHTDPPVSHVRHSSSASSRAPRSSTRSPSIEPQVPKYDYAGMTASAPLGRTLSSVSPYSDLYWQPQNRIRQPSAAVSSQATTTTPGTPSSLHAGSLKGNRRPVTYAATVNQAPGVVKRLNSIKAGLQDLSSILAQAVDRMRHLEELVNKTDDNLNSNAVRQGIMHDGHGRKRRRRERKAFKASNDKLGKMAL